MRRPTILSLALSVVIAVAFAVVAGARTRGEAHVCDGAAKVTVSAAFERIKALAGTWTGTSGHGDQQSPVTVTYKVTAGGSAVLETIAASDAETITVYHLDGEDLVLTHYCSLGNQPRMKADAASQTSGKIVFAFVGGTNLDAAKDQHMHDLTLEILSPTELRADWRLFNAGKQEGTATFKLRRS